MFYPFAGREGTPDAMSLHYADTSLPDLLGRPSLNYADQASVMRGREPPDAMSLCYADTSQPELLGRPSLRFAEMSMRNTSKCACVIQEVF